MSTKNTFSSTAVACMEPLENYEHRRLNKNIALLTLLGTTLSYSCNLIYIICSITVLAAVIW